MSEFAGEARLFRGDATGFERAGPHLLSGAKDGEHCRNGGVEEGAVTGWPVVQNDVDGGIVGGGGVLVLGDCSHRTLTVGYIVEETRCDSE